MSVKVNPASSARARGEVWMDPGAKAEGLRLSLQQRDKGVPLRTAEAASEFLIELSDQPVDPRHHRPPTGRGAHVKRASILVAAVPSYQARGLHFVDQGDHGVAVDTERVRELLLILLGAECEVAEDRERARSDPKRLESRREQLRRPSSDLRQQERERVGVIRLGRRVHASEYRPVRGLSDKVTISFLAYIGGGTR